MGYGGISGNGLLIDKGELTAGVLEEELALDAVDRGENVGEQNCETEQERCSVLVEQDMPVRNQKLQLAQQPEPERQEQGDGHDESVGNHSRFLRQKQWRLI